MIQVTCYIVAAFCVAFILGYATGKCDKEMQKYEDDYEDDVDARRSKPIDFNLSDQDGGFSVPPFLRPYVPREDDSRGTSGTDSSRTDD